MICNKCGWKMIQQAIKWPVVYDCNHCGNQVFPDFPKRSGATQEDFNSKMIEEERQAFRINKQLYGEDQIRRYRRYLDADKRKVIAEIISKAMREKKISQNELACRIQTTIRTIQDYTKGRISPRRNKALLLEDVLGVDIVSLLPKRVKDTTGIEYRQVA